MPLPNVLPPSPPASSSRKQQLLSSITKPLNSTPDDSPASDPDPSSFGSRKKVEFSPWTAVHQPSGPLTTSILSSQVKPLPPSRECSSSGKSILKSTGNEDIASFGLDGASDEQLSLPETMDSIIQQLAMNDNIQSVDAYQTLASVIKAYGEVPEEAMLKTKLSSVTKHIRQDLSLKQKAELDPSTMNLVISALKLAVILVWNQDFSELLNDDFRVFLLEKAVNVISEHKASKTIIMHYLHLLATQDFRSALLLSNNRAHRLVDALRVLTDHVKGNGVVSERLLVYQRLLDQARPIMKNRASSWVDLMLSAMVSSLPDTRNKALALGRKACQAFPVSASISSSIRMALDMKQESGRTLGSSICRRLEKMVITKDEASQVPQMWAVIILLCNSHSTRIDTWASLREWLMVIQRCFNSSDSMLRQQAHLAWNRFVYVARPHEASDSLVSMLVKPILAQIDRISSDKAPKSTQAAAVSSYCNLLYYSFRPAISQSQYTRVWNEYVVKVMRSSFFEKHPGNADIAARCLVSLFWDAKTSTKVWNENRAHENRPIEPEELPTIDPKWTRSRSQHVLQIFQVLFKHGAWGLPGASEQAFVSKAWKHFLKAIHEAGSKEIKLSTDSKASARSTLNFLSSQWAQFSHLERSQECSSGLMSREVLSSITRTAIHELGVCQISEVLDSDSANAHPMVLATLFEILKDTAAREPKLAIGLMSLVSKIGRCFDVALDNTYEQAIKSNPKYSGVIVESISHVLSVLPESLVKSFLSSMGQGFAKWIRDEKHLIESKPNNKTDDVWGMLSRLARTLTSTLSKVQPAMVETFDILFAAAFASTHGTIVNATVQMWNLSFGYSADLRIGTVLGDALDTLRPYFEIDLPTDQRATSSPAARNLLPAYETQQIDSNEKLNTEADHDIHQDAVTVEAFSHSAQADSTSPNSTPAPKHEQEHRQSTGDRKPRHEDSQVAFVAIQSSPHAEVEDSQLLTERQKEVRDQRREEPAVVFPDLRSSPRPRSKRSKTPDCGMARKAAASDERPTTPTLTDHADAMETEAQPSPTPRSKLARNVRDVEVPSSPPSIQGAGTENDHLSSPPSRNDARAPHSFSLDFLQAPTGEVQVIQEACAQDVKEGRPTAEDDEEDKQNSDMQSRQPRQPSLRRESAASYGSPPGAGEVAGSVQDNAPTTSMSMQTDVLADENEAPYYENRAPPGLIIAPHLSISEPTSDELQELTTDQLSQDLDQWSGVFDDLVQTPQISPEKYQMMTAPSNTELEHHQEYPTTSIHEEDIIASVPTTLEIVIEKKRKRLEQDCIDGEIRRKKIRTPSYSPVSDQSQDFPLIKEEDPENILDQIEVASEASIPSSPAGLSQDKDENKRSLIFDVLQEVRKASNRPIIHQSPGNSSERLFEASHNRQSRSRSPQRGPSSQSDEQGRTDSGPSPSPSVAEATDSYRTIEASLHGLLSQLKIARKGDFDLRNVDDLLFQIRCEVHAADQRES